MNIIHPQISKELIQINNFSTYVQDFLSDEAPILDIKSNNERMKGAEFSKIDVRKSIFENCTFHNCSFENGSFMDVVFQSCDFSNSKFTGAYFERCRFVSCKCIGVNMCETIIKQTAFEHSKFQYSFFNKAKITDVLFEHIDFTEATMTEAKLKRFIATDSRFVRNNFFKTMLATIDFSDNEFVAPMVSSPPDELKGIIINACQAVDLISLWGVVVKQ